MDSAPFGSRACGKQATCLDASLDSARCVYRLARDSAAPASPFRRYLYCPVCIGWPRDGSRCTLLPAAAPPPPQSARRNRTVTPAELDAVCAGDRLSQVIAEPGGTPVAGGINIVSPWAYSPGNDSSYCQWVRWSDRDSGTQPVLFSVRSGDKTCAALDVTLMVGLNGMSASCGAPRYFDDATAAVAGCQSNDGTVYNECLWTLNVPRPGGSDWPSDDCSVDATADDAKLVPPPPAPPPARAAAVAVSDVVALDMQGAVIAFAAPDTSTSPSTSTSTSTPAAAQQLLQAAEARAAECSLPQPAEPPSVLGGGAAGSSSGCSAQASCLDLQLNSALCAYRSITADGSSSAGAGGGGGSARTYLYCPVCLSWPRDGSACALDSSAAGAAAVSVCAGDEMSLVVDSASVGEGLGDAGGAARAGKGRLVPGGVATRRGWSPAAPYCQWVRWAADDYTPATAAFSVRGGGACSARRRNANVTLTLRGAAAATCSAPRKNAFGGFAGCAGNDELDDECFWSIDVPRPGGAAWKAAGGKDCAGPPPASPPQSPGDGAAGGSSLGRSGEEGATPPPPKRRRSPPPQPPSPEPPEPPSPSPPTRGRRSPPPRAEDVSPANSSLQPADTGSSPGSSPAALSTAERLARLPFPFSTCAARGLAGSPWRLASPATTQLRPLSDGRARSRHCFDVTVPPAAASGCSGSCCDMDVGQIEVLVSPACRTAVRTALVGGESVTWAFTQTLYRGAAYSTFVLPRLSLSRAGAQVRAAASGPAVSSVQVCVVLAETADSDCSRLSQFCAAVSEPGATDVCRAAFVDSAGSCCPTGNVLLGGSVGSGALMEEVVGAPPMADLTFETTAANH
ncbi:hypothetical protein HXX76_003066 [Chlamydomonas incerta]|uniref:Pherophorin domain-containing protein n=1 Tax=Chlamydomonas incerta TaxID=51695 RepID=A0A835TA65_CHLIN|nr:hypothetical protein HXX76_003066 [Chlamydomonas incerta]|eukprot:KAG2441443.1 hypothetical protein HXX76_003066 [Chlamydomonas incerta]